MTYRVLYTDRVIADLAGRVDRLREDHVAEHVIEAWFSELFDTVDDLYEVPHRYPVDEPESRRRGFEIRKLTFRKYIIRYRVSDRTRTVYVLSFFHGAMRRET